MERLSGSLVLESEFITFFWMNRILCLTLFRAPKGLVAVWTLDKFVGLFVLAFQKTGHFAFPKARLGSVTVQKGRVKVQLVSGAPFLVQLASQPQTRVDIERLGLVLIGIDKHHGFPKRPEPAFQAIFRKRGPAEKEILVLDVHE